MANSGQVISLINEKNFSKLLRLYDDSQEMTVAVREAIV